MQSSGVYHLPSAFCGMVNAKSLRTYYCLTKAILTSKMTQLIKKNKNEDNRFYYCITILADMVPGAQLFFSELEFLFQIQSQIDAYTM